MNDIQLTIDQQKAIDKCKEWMKTCHKAGNKKFFVLSGIAGSGKTTIINSLIHALNIPSKSCSFMSFTGKAVNVLCSKGIDAYTIHKTIYYAEEKVKNSKVYYEYKLKDKSEIPSSLFVIDESSMVSRELFNDLMQYNIPTIFVGDHNQLPPVSSDNEKPFNIMDNPDVRLTEPIRQSLDNSIIELAYNITKKGSIAIRGLKGKFGNNVHFVDSPSMELCDHINQVIVGKNVTRNHFNDTYRKWKNYVSPYPYKGEKLISKKNNRENVIKFPRFDVTMSNGTIGFASYDFDPMCEQITLLPEISKQLGVNIVFSPEAVSSNLFTDKNYDPRAVENKDYHIFDFAYAITCHNSQGSEYDNVLVYAGDSFGDYDLRSRWLYTAVTRAKKNVIIVP